MIEYRYEELTSEEKRFLQYVEDDPFLTTETIFPGKQKYGINIMTTGISNKVMKVCVIVVILIVSAITLMEKTKYNYIHIVFSFNFIRLYSFELFV